MARCKIRHGCLLLLCCLACTHKPYAPPAGSFPPEVASIIRNKCAISGCHNAGSFANADSLDLTSWEGLFRGTGTGAVVIPYRPDFSSLCYFINIDTSLGITLQPTMPLNATPLSRDEYLTIRNWIDAGAPDATGRIKFSTNPARSKFYITNRLCNVVTVIDADSLLQMHFVDVGGNGAQFPYCIRVSPDKQYWYVSFFSPAGFVQKFSAADDKPAGQIDLSNGNWTSFVIASDSRHAWFVDNSNPGKVVYADLAQNAVLATYTFGGNLIYPIGTALNERLHKLYVGTSSGNFVYRIDVADPLNPAISELPIDGTTTAQYQPAQNPTDLLVDTSTNTCYAACNGTGEVRAIDMAHDAVSAVIPLGSGPAFMSPSSSTHTLFVSCPDDFNSFPPNRGSVAVIDVTSNTLLKCINTGYQPYGVAVDDRRGVVAVVNATISGGASHHVSGCGKRNGNVTFIDLHSLQLLSFKRLEVAVFPFGAAVR